MRIEVENLGKRFRREWIFKDFDYKFEEGKVFAIVGPNGSGKSTLLHLLWGQLLPSQGKVKYFAKEKEIPPEEVFQYISIAAPYMELIEEFTLTEMIQFHFKFKTIRPGTNIHDLPTLIQLGHAKNETLGNFSSGMKQRVKLALAFFSETELLFIDEPTTNLDVNAAEWYLDQLAQSRENKTIFIASNQQREYPEDAVKIDLATLK